MMESIIYKKFGERICTPCLDETGKTYSVIPNAEAMRALGREFSSCDNCGMTAIGEPIPKQLQDFFNEYPEETPEHERIT